jgi:hypothetical protein
MEYKYRREKTSADGRMRVEPLGDIVAHAHSTQTHSLNIRSVAFETRDVLYSWLGGRLNLHLGHYRSADDR